LGGCSSIVTDAIGLIVVSASESGKEFESFLFEARREVKEFVRDVESVGALINCSSSESRDGEGG